MNIVTDRFGAHKLFLLAHVIRVSDAFLRDLFFWLSLDAKSYLTSQLVWLY